MTRFLQTLVAASAAATVVLAGCDMLGGVGSGTAAEHEDRKSTASRAPSDAPLAQFQIELLDQAFAAASAIPIKPHLSNRCQAKELAIRTCLELDQPQRSLPWIDGIEDWRRGTCLAEYAKYCAAKGFDDAADDYAKRAADVAAGETDWRDDAIKAAIAQAYLLLGDPKAAARYDTGLVESEAGKSHAIRAKMISEELFTAQLDALDLLIATQQFDQVNNALEACAELFDRFYADLEKRELVEGRIRKGWQWLPTIRRIEILRQLAEASLAHDDHEKAHALVSESAAMVSDLNWQAEYRVPLLAELAHDWHRVGDQQKAEEAAAASLQTFEAGRESIINIYRAKGLRALAETHCAMGERDRAARVYGMALEEGVANPNRRPRAEDLCATLCSMAAHAFEPDETMRSRIREILTGLNNQ